ncbi:4-hydroxy-3-methylbut-2-enyl diphosphate reductase, partial [gut metagenome]
FLSVCTLYPKSNRQTFTQQQEVIFYIGKKGHPEAEGATFRQENVYLIETIADIPSGIDKPIFVTNQTTMSIVDLQELFDEIKRRYPHAVLCDEICNATRVRQKAVFDLAKQDIDLLIVVGDPASNNTRKLAQIGKNAGILNVIQLEDASQLLPETLKGIHRVAITSGASTP